jgi:hypothetical protein
MIDLQHAFKAIDFRNLDRRDKKTLLGVYRFLTQDFQSPVDLSGFEFMEYKTEGKWLTAYLRYLPKHAAVSPEARRDINYILPYVLLTDPGAELVDEILRNWYQQFSE